MASSLQPFAPGALRPSRDGKLVEMHDATGLAQSLGLRCPVFFAPGLWSDGEMQSGPSQALQHARAALVRLCELVRGDAPASSKVRSALLEGKPPGELGAGREPDWGRIFREFLRQTIAGARGFSFDGRWLAFDLEDSMGARTTLTANLSARSLNDGTEQSVLIVSPWQNSSAQRLLDLLAG